jgi:hypothetical protein
MEEKARTQSRIVIGIFLKSLGFSEKKIQIKGRLLKLTRDIFGKPPQTRITFLGLSSKD